MIKAIVFRESRSALGKLLIKAVIEEFLLAPEESNAQLPSGLSALVKLLHGKFEKLMEVAGKKGRRAFSHANDSNFRTAQNGDIHLRQNALEGNCCSEASGASAENNDGLDFHVFGTSTIESQKRSFGQLRNFHIFLIDVAKFYL